MEWGSTSLDRRRGRLLKICVAARTFSPQFMRSEDNASIKFAKRFETTTVYAESATVGTKTKKKIASLAGGDRL
jgi:hypothetical protein